MSDRQSERHPTRQTEAARQVGGGFAGPARAGAGMLHAGATNGDMLAEICEVLGGLPRPGALYRVRFWQGDHHPGFIGEYVGLDRDMVTGYPEPALTFVIRNPVLAANAGDGTRQHPFTLWPIEIEHISPAEAADLERPMSYDVEGEPPARVPVDRACNDRRGRVLPRTPCLITSGPWADRPGSHAASARASTTPSPRPSSRCTGPAQGAASRSC